MAPAAGCDRAACWVGRAVVIAAVLVVFGQVLGFGLVEYDDPAFLRDNPHVNAGPTVHGLKWALTNHDPGDTLRPGVANLWHPVTWISHMLDFGLWGHDYRGHHLTSLLLHLGSALWVFALARRLGGSPAGATLAALWFALHPLQAESVSWLSDRKGQLGNFFLLGALVMGTDRDRRRAHGLGALVLLGLALLSKPSTVVAPALIVLLDLWISGGKSGAYPPAEIPRAVARRWAWVVPAVAVAVATIVIQAAGTHGTGLRPLADRLFLLPATFFHLLERMILPWDLAMHYPQPAFWTRMPGLGILWAAFLGIPWALHRWQARFPAGLPAWCWMLACWLPVSGLVHVGVSFSADRYAGLMLVGPALAVATWFPVRPGRQALVPVALAAVALGGLAILAWKQCATWKSTESLYTHALAAQPDDPIIANNHATMLLVSGRTTDALAALEKSTARFPADAVLPFNLGVCLAKLGRPDEAIAAYRTAIARDPARTAPWLNLGLLLARPDHPGHDPEEALRCLESANHLSGARDPNAVLAIIDFHLRRGDAASAAAWVARTRDLRPGDPKQSRQFDALRARLDAR